MDYRVLSPVGEIDATGARGLLPRVPDLNGKTIGLFSYFKWYGLPIMKGVEEVLKERFPTAKFIHFQEYPQPEGVWDAAYPAMCSEVLENDKRKEAFKEWVKSIDIAVTGHGD